MSLSDDADQADQVAGLRSEIDRLQRRLGSESRRTEAIVTAIQTAVSDSMKALALPPVPAPVPDRRRKGEQTVIVMLSDWQLGKRTPSYDSDICAARVDLLADRTLRLVDDARKARPVKRCAVFLLGDMVEGELIFPGQHWEIDASLYRQVTVDGPRILGGFLRRMLASFDAVDVYAVPGNHGHMGGRARKDMHPESNADRMLYQIVRTVLDGEDRLSWTVPEKDWWTVAEIDGNRFLLLHGDQVRGYNGIPWYGWTRKLQGWSMMSRTWSDMDFRYAAAGHFHTPVSIYVNGVRLWVNASTESHNPYALEQLAASGEPAQWVLFSDPTNGVVSEHLVSLAE